MDQQTRRAAIAQHLENASAAHFEYETTVLQGVYDQQWAEWYADYLLANGWNELFRAPWTGETLAAALRQANEAHRANAPQEKWSDYYAAEFVKVE